jgi:hypothetical protein
VIKLRISCDGSVQGLWTDEIQWAELGVLQVRRASRVEFDERKQCWTVCEAEPRGWRGWLERLFHGPSSHILHRATTRAAALAWEHEYFQPGGAGWRQRMS